MSSSRPHAYLFIIALNSGAEPQLNAMPDLWSKLGLSHSNTISCTATSHQLGKFHIMNHVAPHCTLNNNTLNKVWVLIPNTCTAIQHVSTDIYIIQNRGALYCFTQQRSKFHLWKVLMNILPAALPSSGDQTFLRRKQSRCHNNFTLLPFIQLPGSSTFFLFIFLICFSLN